MPLYDFECPGCKVVWERLAKPEQVVTCDGCHQVATRLIARPASYLAELTPYYDEGLGQRVTSRAQRRARMKALSLEEVGSSRLHGSRGTRFSFPGRTVEGVPKSGAYARG
jgi:hypothetical protein